MEHRIYISLAFWARRRLNLIAAREEQPTDATEDELLPDEATEDEDLTGEPLAA